MFLVHGRLKSLRVEVYDSHLLLTSLQRVAFCFARTAGGRP